MFIKEVRDDFDAETGQTIIKGYSLCTTPIPIVKNEKSMTDTHTIRMFYNSSFPSEPTGESGLPESLWRSTPLFFLHFSHIAQKSFSMAFSIWSGRTTVYSTTKFP